MSVLVKICGITNLEDALAAAEAGADALGFIFYKKSQRYISPEEAATITSQVPASILKIGVFVDEAVDTIARIAAAAGLDQAQLHGNETPGDCAAVRIPVVKALRVKDEGSLADLDAYRVAALLLDSYVADQLGGTGASFNWDLAVKAKRVGLPIILAGGLTPDNVANAIAHVAPFAVDVSSGVELAPGRKDHPKVREFIRRAKSLNVNRAQS